MKKTVRLFRSFLFLFLLWYTATGWSHTTIPEYIYTKWQRLKTDTADIMSWIKAGTAVQWSNPDSAMKLFDYAEQRSKEIHYNDGIGFALINKAHSAVGKGDFNRSFDYYREALPYCRNAIFNPALFAIYYSDLATTYLHMGDYEHASIYYFNSLQEMDRRGLLHSSYVISLYTNMAFMYNSLEQYTQALYYLGLAEQTAHRNHQTGQLAFILNNKGEAFLAAGQPQKALECYTEGLAIARNSKQLSPEKSIEVQQSLDNSLGTLMLKLEQPQQAIRYFQDAMKLSNTTNPYQSFIFPNYFMGQAYFMMGEMTTAEAHLKPALELAQKLNFKEDMLMAYSTLAAIYEQSGRYRNAYEQLANYQRLKDSLLGKEKTETVNQLEIKYRTAQKDKELVQKQLLITQQQSKITGQKIWIWAVSMGALALTAISFLLSILYRNNQQKQRLQQQQIQSMQQEKKLLKKQEDIKVMQALIKGEEKERVRLARDMHDGIGGMVSAVRMQLSVLQNRPPGHIAAADFCRVMDMLEETSAEIRKTAHNLMPDMLLSYNLEEALQLFCDNVNTSGRLQLYLQIHETLPVLGQKISLSLYRILQELVHNIVKHADAQIATIQISVQEEVMYITVEDNGHGFDTDSPRDGIGLQNVQSRVDALQGFFSLESSDKGTVAYIEIYLSRLKTPDNEHTYSYG
ncbi:tetratricopeptide repeat-containing sensor histidine kinase [Chitinophagaceae bacterium MMS25-I14]